MSHSVAAQSLNRVVPAPLEATVQDASLEKERAAIIEEAFEYQVCFRVSEGPSIDSSLNAILSTG